MDSTIYIIHRSAIITCGLAEIIRKNFKCIIKTFNNFEDLKNSGENFHQKSIIFAEEKMSYSFDFQKFITAFNEVILYYIIDSDKEVDNRKSQYSISMYASLDEIRKQIKGLIEKQQLIDEGEEEGLTNREIDVLKQVALGYSNKEIADKLFISIHTVMSHRKNMTEKLGIKSISGLTVYAIINNYIDTTNLDIKDLI